MNELSEAQATEPRPALPPVPSLPARILGTLVDPRAVFRALRENPAWKGATVVGAIALGLVAIATPTELWMAGMRQGIIAAGEAPPEGLERMAGMARWAGAAGFFLFWPIRVALTAGFFTLVFVAAMAYEGRFPQYLAISSHALLVAAFAEMLLLPLRIVTGRPDFALTLGAFAPFLDEGLVAQFLGFVNLFDLWAYVLIGVGAAAIDGDRGEGVSILTAIGSATLLLLVIAILMP